mgnify:CR=1 FL=1
MILRRFTTSIRKQQTPIIVQSTPAGKRQSFNVTAIFSVGDSKLIQEQHIHG